MARKQLAKDVIPQLTSNAFARIVGRNAPLHWLLVKAADALAARAITVRPPHIDPLEDYAQIDPSLARLPVDELPRTHFHGTDGPANGLGYVGFDAEARSRFLLWLDHPERDAPTSFQTLYLAHIESALVEAAATDDTRTIEQVIATLRALEVWPHWRRHAQRARTLLFAYLLLGDGAQIGAWLAEGFPTQPVADVALGWQALLGARLTPAVVLGLARLWDIADEKLDVAVVALRLRSLTEDMGVDPLTYALRAALPGAALPGAVLPGAALPEAIVPDEVVPEAAARVQAQQSGPGGAVAAAAAAKPWRSAHRDLRVDFVQLEMKPWIAPLLAELLDDVPRTDAADAAVSVPQAATEAEATTGEWTLILEFQHSRSEYFELALKQAQRLSGYSALVDENRHVVHRVLIKKAEMRRFWQLWDYVMSWSGTRVYVNGVELDKWKIYPYSQYLT